MLLLFPNKLSALEERNLFSCESFAMWPIVNQCLDICEPVTYIQNPHEPEEILFFRIVSSCS